MAEVVGTLLRTMPLDPLLHIAIGRGALRVRQSQRVETLEVFTVGLAGIDMSVMFREETQERQIPQHRAVLIVEQAKRGVGGVEQVGEGRAGFDRALVGRIEMGTRQA